MVNLPISLNKVEAFVFDFDGVMTNNLVHLDQNGREWVSCSRADGLAFDVLRKLKKPAFILSTEKNSVVTARANKLRIPAIQGVSNKVDGIKELSVRERLNIQNILYVGNDLNDYHVMQLCGFTACPSDSHETIKSISNIELRAKGGDGVVRELLEVVFSLDFIEILYNK